MTGIPAKRKHPLRIIFGYLFRLFVLFVIAVALIAYFIFPFPGWGIPLNYSRHTAPPITPAWALECWLWEDDVNTREEVEDLLAGYREHDFPVRTILIDSPWTHRYNDFKIDEDRYPNPDEFFGKLEADGYRVVLWMTPLVDYENKDTAVRDSQAWFDEAKANGYLTNGGKTISWWKGKGGFVDYTNPDAMQWWRGMQQRVFDLGIDGWKLDGAATLPPQFKGPIPLFYHSTYAGLSTTRRYMDYYYREEYRHGLSQNPEFITLVRSFDRWAHPEGFAPYDAAPVCWVGDQDHTWKIEDEGIEEALTDIIKSAKAGYNIVGSDVAGYSGGEIPPRLYMRWAQFSAFCGLFLNGGHGNRKMWERTDEELEVVRKFSWLHTELVPYIYSHTVECHNGAPPIMRPVGEKFDYRFGDAYFVAPIYEDNTQRRVQLPEGRWHYLFDLTQVHDGPKTIDMDVPIDEFPALIRAGSIVPMHIERAYTGFGDVNDAGKITWFIMPGSDAAFTYHHVQGNGASTCRIDGALNIAVEGDALPHQIRVHTENEPAAVSRDGSALDSSLWSYDAGANALWIRPVSEDPATYAVQF